VRRSNFQSHFPSGRLFLVIFHGESINYQKKALSSAVLEFRANKFCSKKAATIKMCRKFARVALLFAASFQMVVVGQCES
jgi:hypothetical protein